MKEYEQQIDDLINSGDINNWRLALELCRGLIDDFQLFIGRKCLSYVQPSIINFSNDLYEFLIVDCNCTWCGGVDTIELNESE